MLYRNDIIQLFVFKDPNIKIYWCVKGDIDRREQQNISGLGTTSIFAGSHVMCPQPIGEQEFRRKNNKKVFLDV